MCRRAIEPRYGLWTLPAGFMENGETTEEAAVREAMEEALVDVEIIDLYSVFSIPHVSQVFMMFRGRMRSPAFGPGPESLEVRLFAEDEIPWDAIAGSAASAFTWAASSRPHSRAADTEQRDSPADAPAHHECALRVEPLPQ